MTARDGALRLVDRARAQWQRATVARAFVTGCGAALLAAALLAAIDQLAGLPPAARAVLRFAPLALIAGFLVAAARSVRHAPGDDRFALLVEERAPALRGWVTTALAPLADGPIGRIFEERATAAMHRVEDRAWTPLVPRKLARAGGAAAFMAVIALVLVPGGAGELWRRWGALSAGAAAAPAARTQALGADTRSADSGFELSALRITVTAPAYASEPPRTLRGGEAVIALAGSSVHVTGPALPASVDITAEVIGGAPLTGVLSDEEWSAAWRLARGERGISFVARSGDTVLDRRVVPITVVEDGEPVVRLDAPSEDVVLASANGVLPLRATVTDDHGIGDFHVSWILSRGGGESFSFTEGTWRWDARERRGDAIIGSYALNLGAADLESGDVLHVRAIATDANDVTGPGVGVSATRLIHIVRDDEMADVTTLIGFPIEAEKEPILSQRMIILLTERLIARLGSLPADERRVESAGIAREQARLRDRLTDVVYSSTFGVGEEHAEVQPPVALPTRPNADTMDALAWSRRMRELLEAASAATGTGTIEELGHAHDPDPSISVNRELLGAFDAMYAAERNLLQADPRAALPHEYRALEILQKAREAERVFLRGRQAVAPVDVAGVRGTGELEDAVPAAPSAAEPLPTAAAALEEVTALAERLRALSPRDASLALSALAARLLADPSLDARAGALLTRAAEAAGGGRSDDAASLTLQARAVLAPPSPAVRGARLAAPVSDLSAEYFRRLRPEPQPHGPNTGPLDPFVFATVRYASGDWDSGQLVPANLIHSLALYTDIPVAPEGVVVDLDSPDVFRYPFLYLTGHLPVRFNSAESRNLQEFVARGGLIFIDDHNHDIDAAFHRTITAELRRIFGDDTLAPLPNDHELYRAFFLFEDGPPTTSHELNGWGDGLVHESLSAIRFGGRIGVLYSNKDYSSEWSYHVQNKRFQALDNTRFGVNIIVYALTR